MQHFNYWEGEHLFTPEEWEELNQPVEEDSTNE